MPVHFTQGNLTPLCGDGEDNPVTSPNPGDVTCFRCRRTPAFVRAQTGDRAGTPVKLSGVMTQHPVMAGLYAAALANGEDAPNYTHDCSDCEYLGKTGHGAHWVELYYCHGPAEGNVVARKSGEPSDYVSGYSAARHDPDLALAVVRSISKGLMRANALHFL